MWRCIRYVTVVHSDLFARCSLLMDALYPTVPKRREYIAMEILETERFYVDMMTRLVKVKYTITPH